MPEKVLLRFGDDGEGAPEVVEKVKVSGEGGKGKESRSQSTKSAGTKRLRDGSPKLDKGDVKRKKLANANGNGNGAKLVKLVDGEGAETVVKESKKDAGVSNGVGNRTNGTNGVKFSGDKKGERGQSQRSGGGFDNAKNAVPDRHLQKTAKELEPFRKSLPVYKKVIDLRNDLRNKDVLLLTAETGSGKSTQLPQFIHDEPWCKKQKVKVKNAAGQEEEIAVGGVIAITQPRRVAAITLARRVAAEMGSALGYQRTNTPGKVGYSSGQSENVELDGTEDSGGKDTGVAIEEVKGRKFKVELYYDKTGRP
ncbi:hypothetical protein DID88_006311 [Monilinia fructigena]|uniref:RNA helicase n=1 Tax=Monilinia fructigena TaxID=38457 RepID=A0A395J2B6_9HELO|nr:hypothetical protein DID88_006311 [Monilinia fructigena]